MGRRGIFVTQFGVSGGVNYVQWDPVWVSGKVSGAQWVSLGLSGAKWGPLMVSRVQLVVIVQCVYAPFLWHPNYIKIELVSSQHYF